MSNHSDTDHGVVEDTLDYSFALVTASNALVFSWKTSARPTLESYKAAVRRIAEQTLSRRPSLLVIDKRRLETAIAFDTYQWWRAEILPIYHEAGIVGFAHVSGDPNAAGEYSTAPEGVSFRMAEFADLESALEWQLVD